MLSIKFLSKLAGISLALFQCSAWAGNYGVSPLDLSLTMTNKSGVLTVVNEDKKDLEIRMRPTAWTQTNGQDNYVDANDLVVFPRRLTLKPGEKKIIRVGLNDSQSSAEKAYRLYLEEIAPPQDPNDKNVKLSVLINIGVPIFVTPADASSKLSVQSSTTSKGLSFQMANQGNAHIRLSRIADENGNTVTSDFANRYLFAGMSRSMEVPLQAAYCKGGAAKWTLETNETKAIPLNVTLPSSCAAK